MIILFCNEILKYRNINLFNVAIKWGIGTKVVPLPYSNFIFPIFELVAIILPLPPKTCAILLISLNTIWILVQMIFFTIEYRIFYSFYEEQNKVNKDIVVNWSKIAFWFTFYFADISRVV